MFVAGTDQKLMNLKELRKLRRLIRGWCPLTQAELIVFDLTPGNAVTPPAVA